jgi:hypothetical protein
MQNYRKLLRPLSTLLSFPRRGFHTNGPTVSDSDVTSLVKKALRLLMYFLVIPLICTGRYRREFQTDFRLLIVVTHECRHVSKGQ